MSNFAYEDGSPITCIHCDHDIDFDKAEEAWFHLSTGYFTCIRTVRKSTVEEEAQPKCMWDFGCEKPGAHPLIEETREIDTEVVLDTRYLSFLCQRHLKVCALISADQTVP